ncbi:hypothetical protein BKA59DRAFT_471466 [Fusarium tricinctum]|uniref:Zn(2)-C6 fungal-type domain-containing protein n=1 Tax=Fusarium tricinctum TaxID=61284 RepID=A0A8K0RZJ3_9HYPO|nr:hypothetical protein BKA59DRAFT_471466 [Fusarium tricinctum]
MATPSITHPENSRLLLPKASDGPSRIPPSHTTNLTPPRRKYKILAACQPCKTKKVRCDGLRPACGVCESKGRACAYPAEGSMADELVRRQYMLQENVESFAMLYRYLQDRPAEEANGLFEKIRNGFGIEAALAFIKEKDTGSTVAHRDPPSARVEWSQQINGCSLLFESELLATETSEVAVQTLRDGVVCYLSCLGTMFPIYTKSEVDSIISTFLSTQPDPGGTDHLANRKIAYGELLAVCALGFQYDRQNLPDGEASLCTALYQKARLFLDHVMEKAPLRAMRICCCLGMYNVIAKSSLAISYTDWGILIGSSSGLSLGRNSLDLSQLDFQGHVRTFTALVTIRSWVTATLGHIPSLEVSRCIHELKQQMYSSSSDCTGENAVINTLQHKMAQITLIKANVLQTVTSFRVLSPAILKQMQKDLELWLSDLPAYMRLETLVQSSEIEPDQRRVTFYMHLFYMSALILKARALLATQGEPLSSLGASQAAFAIVEGVRAARDSARLLGLIHDERAVVKNCWLTIYQCYVTFLTLNYAAVKGFLVGGATAFRQQDIALSGKCIEILELCATKDRIAHRFHTHVTKYQSVLQELLPQDDNASVESFDLFEKNVPNDSYLFVETEGDTKLHHLINELLEMLCYPLTLLKESNKNKIRYPTIVEASVNADINFSRHLTSPFNVAEDEVPVDLFPPGDKLWGTNGFGEEAGGFMSGSAPFGWDTSA